jgi:hypothetical protein
MGVRRIRRLIESTGRFAILEFISETKNFDLIGIFCSVSFNFSSKKFFF